MIKHTVINAELGYALATARHKDAIVICDANMPIPDGCNVIDVSLVRGVPTLVQTMCAILNRDSRVRSRSDRSRRTRHESNARDCCKDLRSTCTRKDQR